MHRMPPRALWLGLAAILAIAPGCSDFDDWDYSRFPGSLAADGAGVGTCDAAASCDCEGGGADVPLTGCRSCLESLVGKAFLARELTVTEPIVPNAPDPEALPKFLNKIWQEDVRRYILNIMLRVDSVDAAAGTLTLVGGAGWHDLDMEDLPLEPGDPLTQFPTSFFFISHSNTFTLQLDENCHFDLVGPPPSVGFHPGPEEHANICTPEYDNAIPIEELVPEGDIPGDCSGILNGVLVGCIPKAAADKICSWGPAPDYSDWYFEQNDDFVPVDGTADYCKHWCGTTPGTSVSAWTNFGGFVSVIRVPLSCDSDGDGVLDGYGIRGEFTAEIVNYAEPQ